MTRITVAALLVLVESGLLAQTVPARQTVVTTLLAKHGATSRIEAIAMSGDRVSLKGDFVSCSGKCELRMRDLVLKGDSLQVRRSDSSLVSVGPVTMDWKQSPFSQ